MTRGTPIPETMTLHVPFRIVKRGGRKEMQMPAGQHAGQGARMPCSACRARGITGAVQLRVRGTRAGNVASDRSHRPGKGQGQRSGR